MTELRSGENRPWPEARLTAYVADAQVTALLLGDDGRALGAGPWVDATSPVRAGVEHLPGPVQGVSVVPAALDPRVARVLVVATRWTSTPTAQLLTADGSVAFTVTPDHLTTETALVMVEAYRRDGVWKVRAVAQGHDGGLAALAAAYGAGVPIGQQTPPVLDDPARQVAMILDDASRSTAALESSTAYAERRLEHDLEQLVGDPSLRVGPAGEVARARAEQRRDDLVAEAQARHRADLAQLQAELDGLTRVMPAALAPWPAPGWEEQRPSAEAPWAVRLGEIGLASAPAFRLPMVRSLPLAPAVWIETADGVADDAAVAAGRMMSALALRVVVALPRAPQLFVVDVGDRARLGHLPLSAPPATDPTSAADLLHEHVEHLRLVALARRSHALDDLPPRHRHHRLLLLPDVPGGLDERSVAAVHQLVTHGAEGGVSVVLSGPPPASLGIAVLDLMHDQCLRVPTSPGGDLVDTHGGVGWVFHPDLGPDDPFVAQRVHDVVRRRTEQRDRP